MNSLTGEFFNKLFLILFIVNIYDGSASAQTVEVTFQVDMSQENISPNGVHIAGDFQSAAGLGPNWSPGTTPLRDDDGDQIYSIRVAVPPNTYQYKFINGSAWGTDENPPAECSVGPTFNREVSIGTTNMVLPPVPFNACLASINFSVNMTGQDISPDGIHIMGNFQKAAGFQQNWDASTVLLSDLNGDSTYEINLMLPSGDYEYLFVNGNKSSQAEVLTGQCATPTNNNSNNREISVTLDTPSPPVYCFNTCDTCNPKLHTDFDTYWWNDAVFYEIFVRSFYDSNGDGIGDFQGIIEKLDYLNDGNPDTDTDLGVTAIWLMPMMESPSYHGYDVTDYYRVEPDYGTMADFEAFLQEAHNRGIKVIVDLVLNHSSNQHPWFTQSANNDNSFRDWYIWSTHKPDFLGPWGQDVWHRNEADYYYGLFWGGMPDLNYNHQPTKEEMFNVANFWLDKGVDGFRLDAIKYLIEDGDKMENTPATFSLLEEFSRIYKSNNPNAFTIGEVWSNTASIIPYVQNERLDVCFEFDLASDIISAVNNKNPLSIQQQMNNIQSSYPALQYGTFLTNHDINRVFNQVGLNTQKMKLAASIYLTLPGVPFLYYGEEVSMIGTGAHENIRRPMQWSDAAHAGFSTVTPWISIGQNYKLNNVATMESNPNALLSHYKKLIHIRNQQAPLRRGNYLDLKHSQPGVLSFVRIHDNNGVIVVSNLTTQMVNPSLTLPASNLSPGLYHVTDLYNDRELGTITIDGKGGFENWKSTSTGIASRTTHILQLSQDNPVPTKQVKQPEFDFLIFPNPNHQTLYIQKETESLQHGLVTILSADGSIMYSTVMESESLQVQTNDWPQGVYFIQIHVQGKIGIKRLVIL